MKISKPFHFAMAREFHENGILYQYKPNRIERIGKCLCSVLGGGLHLTIKEIKNPITIVALTAITALIITLAFYPTTFLVIAPFIAIIKPWMVKATIFIVFQTAIVGLGMRNYGRLINDELREKWNREELKPLFIGDRKIVTR